MLPIILLAGKAGSGKDTVAALIAKHYGGVTIGQADPMKRFVKEVFGFDDEYLWGMSSERDRFHTSLKPGPTLELAKSKAFFLAPSWVESILPPGRDDLHTRAVNCLIGRWWEDVEEAAAKHGGLSVRSVLQPLGTEWGRDCVYRDLWTEYAYNAAKKLLGGGYSYDRSLAGVKRDSNATGASYVVINDGRFRNEIVSVLSHGGQTWRINRDSTKKDGHSSEIELNSVPDHFFTHTIDNNFDKYALELSVRIAMTAKPAIKNYWDDEVEDDDDTCYCGNKACTS